MTKRQRAQVVELLRCAADCVMQTARPIAHAALSLGVPDSRISAMALEARAEVGYGNFVPPSDDEAYRTQILEAAARVEEGSWP